MKNLKINLKYYLLRFASQEKFALINVFLLMELILIVKALAGIPVTVPSIAFGFLPGVVGHSFPPMFLCTLCVFITDCTYLLTLSFLRLHEHVVR